MNTNKCENKTNMFHALDVMLILHTVLYSDSTVQSVDTACILYYNTHCTKCVDTVLTTVYYCSTVQNIDTVLYTISKLYTGYGSVDYYYIAPSCKKSVFVLYG